VDQELERLVVQLMRDPPAFFLLDLEQEPGETTHVLALATAGAVRLIAAGFARRDLRFPAGGNFLDRSSRFHAYFLPVAYGLIPVVGADYFARQLPKFFQHVPRLVPAVQQTFGFAGIRSPLYQARLLSDPRIVIAQVAVIAVGTAGALWSTWRIAGRELVPISRGTAGVRAVTAVLVLACGLAAAWLYVLMNAAD